MVSFSLWLFSVSVSRSLSLSVSQSLSLSVSRSLCLSVSCFSLVDLFFHLVYFFDSQNEFSHISRHSRTFGKRGWQADIPEQGQEASFSDFHRWSRSSGPRPRHSPDHRPPPFFASLIEAVGPRR